MNVQETRVVVVLTALDLEYDAVRRHLTDVHDHVHAAGTRFEVGTVIGSGCRIALALVGKGNQAAAVLAERSIAEFRPIGLFFVGVAGARRASILLGDVVVATHVYAYHGGTSEDDGFRARPRVWEVPHALDQLARYVHRSGSWARGLPSDDAGPVKVHFAPIAAGEVVLQSRTSQHAEWIRDHYNDAAAVEMEGAGVAHAAHLNASLPVMLVRGISDMATAEKQATDRAGWQPRAAARAAAFAVALASAFATSDPEDSLGRRRDRPEATPEERNVKMTQQNIARDHATVGAQIGHLNGGMHVNGGIPPRTDLVAELDQLRNLLRAAQRSGRLDEATFSAAGTELDTANACLPLLNDEKRSKALVALKRLRGLVGDVADLTTKVVAAIALVNGMA